MRRQTVSSFTFVFSKASSFLITTAQLLFVPLSFPSRAFITIAMAASPAVLAQAATQKKPEGLALYSRFAFAGAVCCSLTHGAFTPVDVYVSLRLGFVCDLLTLQ